MTAPATPPPGPAPTSAPASGPARGTALRRWLRNPIGVAAAAVLLLIVLAILLAPWLSPQGPDAASLAHAFQGPRSGHPFGFDTAGRDVLARVLYGGRTTLGGAVLALGTALVLGIAPGLAAGYYGGWFDGLANWAANLVMALPAMVVLLASRAVLGSTVWVLMLVLGVLVSPAFFRLVRSTVGRVRHEPYVDAARVAGLRDHRIIARHILIAVRGPILIQTALVAGIAINLQAGLEFLGIGGDSAATWGSMLNEAFQNIQRDPLLILWPGLALGLTSAALVLLAASLRDALEGSADRPGRRGRTAGPRTADSSGAPPGPASAAESAPADALLAIRGLAVAYPGPAGPGEVVSGVDLEVAAGEILGLVGESGSGKSQTAYSILGILPEGGRVTRGSVTVAGTEVVGLSERRHRELRGTTMAYVPQEPMSNLDPSFTVGSQLGEPLRHRLGLSRRQARARVLELLRQVEIREPERVYRCYPHEISGGMAQRVLIAGAMSCDPRLLIADEPTTALDVRVQAEVLDLLRGLQRERGMGVLLVTHNLGVVADLCDRVAVMRAGRIVETGRTEEVLGAPAHPYTRTLLDAVLDDTAARAPWEPRKAPIV